MRSWHNNKKSLFPPFLSSSRSRHCLRSRHRLSLSSVKFSLLCLAHCSLVHVSDCFLTSAVPLAEFFRASPAQSCSLSFLEVVVLIPCCSYHPRSLHPSH